MSGTKANAIANYVGQGVNLLLLVVCAPIYKDLMGIEAFGLVGIFLVLQALSAPLDLGLSTTINREFAALTGQRESGSEMRDLLRTLEGVYFLIAVAIASLIVALAPWIAGHWINPESLTIGTVKRAIMLIGPVLAFYWISFFYSGGMLGLQRHVALNVILVCMDVARYGGAVLVLWRVSPTIPAFFLWQACVNALHAVILAVAVRVSLPPTSQPARFRKELLRKVGKFAAGMSGIAVMALILTHVDKIILSRLLTLKMFGYYSLAAIVAGGLYRIVGPLYATLFPRFSELVAAGDEQKLKPLYHVGCQTMSVLILPAATCLCLFSREVLMLWTRDAAVVENAYMPLSLLVLGMALNGMMHLPYAAQLAHGWTKLEIYASLISLTVMVPLMLLLTSRYGATGAAGAWAIVNTGPVLITMQVMHRFILKGELMKWYVADVGMPLVGALAVGVAGRMLLPQGLSVGMQFLALAMIGGGALVASALCAPLVRTWLMGAVWRHGGKV